MPANPRFADSGGARYRRNPLPERGSILHWKEGFLAALALVLIPLAAFCRFPTNDQSGRVQLPAELQGVKVYHLPDKNPGKAQGNPAIPRSLAYQHIDLERLVLNLSLSLKPVDRAATVRKIYFQDVRLNGVPVHIDTYEGEFKLSRKETVDLPSPLRASFIFSELDSLEPVLKLVKQDLLHLTGQSFILVQLNTLESVVMRSKQVVLPVSLDEKVPLHMFSDEPMIQAAALKLLDTLSSPFSLAASVLAKQHLAKTTAERTLAARAEGTLFLIYCEYSLRNRQTHEVQRYTQSGTGFLIGAEGSLLTAKRVVQPWKYDPQITFLLGHSGFELEAKAYRLVACPVGAPVLTADGEIDTSSALSSQAHTLEVLKTAPDVMEERRYEGSASGQATVSLHAEGANDVALLKAVRNRAADAVLATGADTAAPNSAVLLGFPFGVDQPQAKFQQTTTALDRDPNSAQPGLFRLARALNPGEAGGPLVTPDAKVIAICGGPYDCIPIAAALQSVQ